LFEHDVTKFQVRDDATLQSFIDTTTAGVAEINLENINNKFELIKMLTLVTNIKSPVDLDTY